jgi:uncharacterized membrane protein
VEHTLAVVVAVVTEELLALVDQVVAVLVKQALDKLEMLELPILAVAVEAVLELLLGVMAVLVVQA